MQSSVFISYVREDKAAADWICGALERNGLLCWMAPRDIASGLEWGAAIVDALDRAGSLVIVFSGATSSSKHVSREVERADRRDIPLVLVRLEDAEPTGTLAYFLSNRQWLDCFTIAKRAWPDRIAAALREPGSDGAVAKRRERKPRKVEVQLTVRVRKIRRKLPADFAKATLDYESWLAKHSAVVPAELNLKHRIMRSGFFGCVRATYYRWFQLFPTICPDLMSAPAVLAVGDANVTSFGTWRDRDNRLIWGIHYFDEADVLPYANDLVRLAAGMRIAAEESGRRHDGEKACAAILNGYSEGLNAGGRPFFLEEDHAGLRVEMMQHADPIRFWKRIREMSAVTTRLPGPVLRLIDKALPHPRPPYDVVARATGLASLGRQRYLVRSTWQGGTIAFQVKALTPPASAWISGDRKRAGSASPELLARAVRSGDPSIMFRDGWMIRRIAPDFERVDLLPLKPKSERRLLAGMGWELANIHLGTKKAAAAIGNDLNSRRPGWLNESAQAMTNALWADWEQWSKEELK